MRITLDENMPARLVRELGELGHNVDTVPVEQLASRPDAPGTHYGLPGLTLDQVRPLAAGRAPIDLPRSHSAEVAETAND